MAELQIEGGELVLHLSGVEKLEAVRDDFRAPLSTVRAVEVLDDAHEPADHGFKVGERLPAVSDVAVVRTGGQRVFAPIHRDTPRGVRIDFDGTDYAAWIVGCSDPEAMKARIEKR
jgi:hypothetical protein